MCAQYGQERAARGPSGLERRRGRVDPGGDDRNAATAVVGTWVWQVRYAVRAHAHREAHQRGGLPAAADSGFSRAAAPGDRQRAADARKRELMQSVTPESLSSSWAAHPGRCDRWIGHPPRVRRGPYRRRNGVTARLGRIWRFRLAPITVLAQSIRDQHGQRPEGAYQFDHEHERGLGRHGRGIATARADTRLSAAAAASASAVTAPWVRPSRR